MRIAVTGAGGMLGTALLDVLRASHDVFATGRNTGYSPGGVSWEEFDLRDSARLDRWLAECRPDVVVHCAALVNIDDCDRNPGLADPVHVGATSRICEHIVKFGGRVIYVSTDSVFDGHKSSPYVETDRPAPRNVYSRTKLEGEGIVLATRQGTVLRTNIFGWSRAPRTSFAEWVLKGLIERAQLKMFSDVTYTPIHVTHFSEIITHVIDRRLSGLFHAGGVSVISKHQFALVMAEAFGLSPENIASSSIDDAGLAATRPKNMALSSALIQQTLGMPLPAVESGVELLRRQYADGWVAEVRGRSAAPHFRFWESNG